jgi:dihydroxyacid dehydratase/phosphogluconate dehydratase
VAKSTGLVVTAGAISALDLIMNDYDNTKMLRITGATVAAALVSAGLDKIVPGLGTGASALLVVAVLIRSGPSLANKIYPATKGLGK